MSTPAIDIKDYMVANGIGTFGGSSGWCIFVGALPENPDTAIAIYDAPGENANPKFSLDYPRWRMRIRASQNDYLSAATKAKEIKNLLLGLQPQTINGTLYDGIYMVGDIFFFEADSKARPIFVTNWRGILEPPVSGNRISL